MSTTAELPNAQALGTALHVPPIEPVTTRGESGDSRIEASTTSPSREKPSKDSPSSITHSALKPSSPIVGKAYFSSLAALRSSLLSRPASSTTMSQGTSNITTTTVRPRVLARRSADVTQLIEKERLALSRSPLAQLSHKQTSLNNELNPVKLLKHRSRGSDKAIAAVRASAAPSTDAASVSASTTLSAPVLKAKRMAPLPSTTEDEAGAEARLQSEIRIVPGLRNELNVFSADSASGKRIVACYKPQQPVPQALEALEKTVPQVSPTHATEFASPKTALAFLRKAERAIPAEDLLRKEEWLVSFAGVRQEVLQQRQSKPFVMHSSYLHPRYTVKAKRWDGAVPNPVFRGPAAIRMTSLNDLDELSQARIERESVLVHDLASRRGQMPVKRNSERVVARRIDAECTEIKPELPASVSFKEDEETSVQTIDGPSIEAHHEDVTYSGRAFASRLPLCKRGISHHELLSAESWRALTFPERLPILLESSTHLRDALADAHSRGRSLAAMRIICHTESQTHVHSDAPLTLRSKFYVERPVTREALEAREAWLACTARERADLCVYNFLSVLDKELRGVRAQVQAQRACGVRIVATRADRPFCYQPITSVQAESNTLVDVTEQPTTDALTVSVLAPSLVTAETTATIGKKPLAVRDCLLSELVGKENALAMWAVERERSAYPNLTPLMDAYAALEQAKSLSNLNYRIVAAQVGRVSVNEASTVTAEVLEEPTATIDVEEAPVSYAPAPSSPVVEVVPATVRDEELVYLTPDRKIAMRQVSHDELVKKEGWLRGYATERVQALFASTSQRLQQAKARFSHARIVLAPQGLKPKLVAKRSLGHVPLASRLLSFDQLLDREELLSSDHATRKNYLRLAAQMADSDIRSLLGQQILLHEAREKDPTTRLVIKATRGRIPAQPAESSTAIGITAPTIDDVLDAAEPPIGIEQELVSAESAVKAIAESPSIVESLRRPQAVRSVSKEELLHREGALMEGATTRYDAVRKDLVVHSPESRLAPGHVRVPGTVMKAVRGGIDKVPKLQSEPVLAPAAEPSASPVRRVAARSVSRDALDDREAWLEYEASNRAFTIDVQAVDRLQHARKGLGKDQCLKAKRATFDGQTPAQAPLYSILAAYSSESESESTFESESVSAPEEVLALSTEFAVEVEEIPTAALAAAPTLRAPDVPTVTVRKARRDDATYAKCLAKEAAGEVPAPAMRLSYHLSSLKRFERRVPQSVRTQSRIVAVRETDYSLLSANFTRRVVRSGTLAEVRDTSSRSILAARNVDPEELEDREQQLVRNAMVRQQSVFGPAYRKWLQPLSEKRAAKQHGQRVVARVKSARVALQRKVSLEQLLESERIKAQAAEARRDAATVAESDEVTSVDGVEIRVRPWHKRSEMSSNARRLTRADGKPRRWVAARVDDDARRKAAAMELAAISLEPVVEAAVVPEQAARRRASVASEEEVLRARITSLQSELKLQEAAHKRREEDLLYQIAELHEQSYAQRDAAKRDRDRAVHEAVRSLQLSMAAKLQAAVEEHEQQLEIAKTQSYAHGVLAGRKEEQDRAQIEQARLSDALAASKAENSRLAASLLEANTQRSAAESRVAFLEGENKRLAAQLQAMRAREEQLAAREQSKVDAAQSLQITINDLRSTIASLQSENSSLREELIQQKAASEAVAVAAALQVSQLRELNNELNQQLASTVAKLEQAKKDIQRLQDDYFASSTEAAALRARIAQPSSAISTSAEADKETAIKAEPLVPEFDHDLPTSASRRLSSTAARRRSSIAPDPLTVVVASVSVEPAKAPETQPEPLAPIQLEEVAPVSASSTSTRRLSLSELCLTRTLSDELKATRRKAQGLDSAKGATKEASDEAAQVFKMIEEMVDEDDEDAIEDMPDRLDASPGVIKHLQISATPMNLTARATASDSPAPPAGGRRSSIAAGLLAELVAAASHDAEFEAEMPRAKIHFGDDGEEDEEDIATSPDQDLAPLPAINLPEDDTVSAQRSAPKDRSGLQTGTLSQLQLVRQGAIAAAAAAAGRARMLKPSSRRPSLAPGLAYGLTQQQQQSTPTLIVQGVPPEEVRKQIDSAVAQAVASALSKESAKWKSERAELLARIEDLEKEKAIIDEIMAQFDDVDGDGIPDFLQEDDPEHQARLRAIAAGEFVPETEPQQKSVSSLLSQLSTLRRSSRSASISPEAGAAAAAASASASAKISGSATETTAMLAGDDNPWDLPEEPQTITVADLQKEVEEQKRLLLAQRDEFTQLLASSQKREQELAKEVLAYQEQLAQTQREIDEMRNAAAQEAAAKKAHIHSATARAGAEVSIVQARADVEQLVLKRKIASLTDELAKFTAPAADDQTEKPKFDFEAAVTRVVQAELEAMKAALMDEKVRSADLQSRLAEAEKRATEAQERAQQAEAQAAAATAEASSSTSAKKPVSTASVRSTARVTRPTYSSLSHTSTLSTSRERAAVSSSTTTGRTSSAAAATHASTLATPVRSTNLSRTSAFASTHTAATAATPRTSHSSSIAQARAAYVSPYSARALAAAAKQQPETQQSAQTTASTHSGASRAAPTMSTTSRYGRR